ncbi:MAG: hypothetical protein ACSHWS_14060 [Sulfitobacter sp.]
MRLIKTLRATALAFVWGAAAATTAHAFTAVTTSRTAFGGRSSCRVEIASDTTGFATVRLIMNAGTIAARAGGSEHVGGSPNTNPALGGPVTAAILANCGYTNISNLTQTGASGTWASDSFMGFSFRGLSSQTAGAVLSDHVFELNGATGTTVTARITPVGTVTNGGLSTAPFQEARANQLINNQPDLIGVVNGNASNVFNIDASDGLGSFELNVSSKTGFWTQARGSYAKDRFGKTHYAFGAVGAHVSLNQNVSVGGLFEFDSTSYKLGGGEMSGTGWLAGPYVVAKLPNQPLYFEGRALFGESNNKLVPGGGGVTLDGIKTKRMLLQAKVQGAYDLGAVTLKPLLDATYTTDKRKAYSHSSGLALAEESVRLGHVAIGADFEMPVNVSYGTLKIKGGLSGIWAETNRTIASPVQSSFEGGRAKANLGFDYEFDNGGLLRADAFYDGLGASDYRSYGMGISYGVTF